MLIDGPSSAFETKPEGSGLESELLEISKIYGDLSLVSQDPSQDTGFRDALNHQCIMTELIDNDLKKRIYWNVTKYLGGQWQKVSCCEFEVKQISGGLSNYLYMCSLPPDTPPENGEPQTVLVRIFGDLLKHDALVMDCVVFALLAEKGLGPQLHGVFPGGRIEEFIPSVCLKYSDLCVPDISRRLAHQLASFHALHMPTNKDPNNIFSLISRYIEELRLSSRSSSDVRLRAFVEDNDLPTQLDQLRETLRQVNSPVVFCHNDLQAGNILKFGRLDGGYELKMIDYEFSGYGYRGFDLANHFCEWTFDNFYPDPPYYQYHPDKRPSSEQLSVFFESYRRGQAPHPSLSDASLAQEVRYFTLLSHLLWALWAAAQAPNTGIQFDFMSYAECRMDLFNKLKADLSSKPVQDFSECSN